jgi:putative inorganic carbon (hco3(-)) transporter
VRRASRCRTVLPCLDAGVLAARALLLHPASPPQLVAAGLLASFLVGGLLAHNLPLGVKLLAAVGYCLLVFVSLPLGVAVWVVVNFFEATPALEFGVKAAGVVLAIAWIGTLSDQRAAVAELWHRHARLVGAALGLLLWVVLSLTWSERPDLGASFWQWPVAVAVFFIVATTVVREAHVRLLAGAFVVGALLSAVSGLGSGETALSGLVPGVGSGVNPHGRVQGGVGGANFLATGIVSAMALAGGLAAARRQPGLRAALLFAVAILALALVSTQSRGGLLALLAAALSALILFRRQLTTVLFLVVLALGATALSIAASPEAAERLTEDTRGGSGRIDTWRVAREVSEDHLLTGVGVHNLHVHALRYVDELDSVEAANTLAREQVAHNVFIEMLAETGVVGLALFLAVIGGCLRAALRAARSFDALREPSLAAMSRAVVVAMVGSLAASLFLSGGGGERLWVLFALGPALLGIAARKRAGETAGG